MRFLVTKIALFILGSCNVRETYAKLEKLKKDLSKNFNHENINTIISWGTGKDSNKISVEFLEFDMNDKKYEDLETMASKVRNRVLEINPEFKKLELIEVLFTKDKDIENPGNVTTFKFRN